MRPFYNTPGLVNPEPPPKPQLTGQALVDKLRDDFADYRESCDKGYCKGDPAVYERFRNDIRKAKEALK